MDQPHDSRDLRRLDAPWDVTQRPMDRHERHPEPTAYEHHCHVVRFRQLRQHLRVTGPLVPGPPEGAFVDRRGHDGSEPAREGILTSSLDRPRRDASRFSRVLPEWNRCVRLYIVHLDPELACAVQSKAVGALVEKLARSIDAKCPGIGERRQRLQHDLGADPGRVAAGQADSAHRIRSCAHHDSGYASIMEAYRLRRDGSRDRLQVPFRGPALLNAPLYNKSTAFTHSERAAFGLEGLLPDAVSTMDQQARRVYDNIARKTDALERYIGLAALQDRNEHLFHRVLLDHLEEFLPVVYTPTVGQACQLYSRIFRRTRGLWITPQHEGRIHDVLRSAPFAGVRLVVVTDNERILGLGDQGAGGMGIPIGKLALYSAAAGIHPAQTLPVSLDVGTDNQGLLADDLYLGWRQPRLRGDRYDALVREFVDAIKRTFPDALLQWEDFKKGTALRLLDTYRHELPSFNDDVQGTAAVAVAGVLAGLRGIGARLREQRIVILGAGAAGVGIARLLRTAVGRAGLERDQLTKAIAVLDSRGFVVADREIRDDYKRELAWPSDLAGSVGLGDGADRSLLGVVTAFEPTILIGTSGQAGAFDEKTIRAMASKCERPIIFPLSNPTANSEATPSDLLGWTDGRALIATGSPFDPVVRAGVTHRIGQGNNVFIFPGVGLGALVAEAREVTDGMFEVAANTLATQVAQQDLNQGMLFPPVTALRETAAKVAIAVVREARDAGVGREIDDDEIGVVVAAAMWEPAYPEMTAV